MQLISTTDRAAVGRLITMPQFVDVIIPRGGKGLIERISAEARVPVIKHLDGNCHSYVDAEVDLDLALKVVDNAKTQKYSPCNATESLLVHAAQAAAFLPRIGAVFAAKGVEMRGCPRTLALLGPLAGARLAAASEADWGTEYLAPIISIKVVDSLDEAIAHINRHGSHHTDAILTTNHPNAMRFPARGRFGQRDGQRQHPLRRTASSTAWAPRSASPPTSSTPVVRSAWRG